jgi:hypothetical protein
MALELIGVQDRVWYQPLKDGPFKWSKWQLTRTYELGYNLEDEYGVGNVQTRKIYAEMVDNSPPR